MKQHLIYILLTLLCYCTLFAQHNEIPVDSIYILRKLSRDEQNYTPEERLAFAQRSLELAKLTKVDSTIMFGNTRLANVNFANGNYDAFFKQMHKGLKMAENLNNKKVIAGCNSDLAIGYNSLGEKDSAYIYAIIATKYIEYNEPINKHHDYQTLADIYHDINLYSKSEENAIKALEYLNLIPNSIKNLNDKWTLYNLLGLISFEQNRIPEALKYYNKCDEICKTMIYKGSKEGELIQLYTFNNKADVYRSKKLYDFALEYYYKILEKRQILKLDPTFYPLIIESIAFTKFLKDETNVQPILNDLKKAYLICDTIKFPNAHITQTKQFIAIDLAEVYKGQQNDSAIKYAQQAYKFSTSISDNEYRLESLKLLGELEKGKAGKAHLKEYIRLSDSINKEERNMRNKFVRIEYESDQLEADNAKLSKEKQWLYSIAASLLGISLLIYIILIQRSKNRKLKFSKAQQQANEDIYSLMLGQQHQLEKGRLQERHRVSEELHDGVLSQLFGTRSGLSFLELEGDTDNLKKFNAYLEQMNTIEKEVRHLSHDLKTNLLSTQNNFNAIIKSLLDQQTELHNITYSFNHAASVNWTTVTDKIKVNLYRILQEALYNTIKHAQATTINIEVNAIDNNLQLTISDNGRGFNPKRVKKGIGLKNIRSRVKALKDTVFVDSYSDKGTTIQLSIPLTRL